MTFCFHPSLSISTSDQHNNHLCIQLKILWVTLGHGAISSLTVLVWGSLTLAPNIIYSHHYFYVALNQSSVTRLIFGVKSMKLESLLSNQHVYAWLWPLTNNLNGYEGVHGFHKFVHVLYKTAATAPKRLGARLIRADRGKAGQARQTMCAIPRVQHLAWPAQPCAASLLSACCCACIVSSLACLDWGCSTALRSWLCSYSLACLASGCSTVHQHTVYRLLVIGASLREPHTSVVYRKH